MAAVEQKRRVVGIEIIGNRQRFSARKPEFELQEGVAGIKFLAHTRELVPDRRAVNLKRFTLLRIGAVTLKSGALLRRLEAQKRITIDVEGARVGLAPGVAEGIDRRANFDLDETRKQEKS